MKHNLKTDPALFDASWNGLKPWEIRVNDRNFVEGDTYALYETAYSGQEMKLGMSLAYTGRVIKGVIEYVADVRSLEGTGLSPDWVILTVKHIASYTVDPVTIEM